MRYKNERKEREREREKCQDREKEREMEMRDAKDAGLAGGELCVLPSAYCHFTPRFPSPGVYGYG